MTPVFMTKQVSDTGWAKCVGEDDKHLKLTLVQSRNYDNKLSAIGFGLGNKLNLTKHKSPFNITYTIDENHWNNEINLQLKLKDIKP